MPPRFASGNALVARAAGSRTPLVHTGRCTREETYVGSLAPRLHRSRDVVGRGRVVLCLAVVTLAGTARADHTLTLDDALALAREHNRDLRASRARLAAAQEGIAEARAALLPQIAAQGKYTHNYKQVTFNFSLFSQSTVGLAQTIRTSTHDPSEAAALAMFEAQTSAMIAATPPIQIQLSEQFDGYLAANVPLVAPAQWYTLAAAGASVRSSEASYEVNEADVLVAVAQAFFAAAGTDELVAARQNAVSVAKETYSVAQARAEVQAVNLVDVTRAEAASVRAQQDLAVAENQRAIAYRALATLIDTHDTFQVVPPNVQPHEAGDRAVLVREALAKRPELSADRSAIEAARETAKSYAWRWSPVLSAWGTGRLFNYTGFSGDKFAWAVGLQLDWVLYDGGLRDAQRRVAEAQQVEAQAALDLEQDKISDEVANALGTRDTQRAGVTAAERTVVLAKEALRIIRVQYDAGAVKQLDVLQAQDSLVSAEVALAQAHFDLALADIQLARATGAFPRQP
jgi:outer membrane protein TolC